MDLCSGSEDDPRAACVLVREGRRMEGRRPNASEEGAISKFSETGGEDGNGKSVQCEGRRF